MWWICESVMGGECGMWWICDGWGVGCVMGGWGGMWWICECDGWGVGCGGYVSVMGGGWDVVDM